MDPLVGNCAAPFRRAAKAERGVAFKVMGEELPSGFKLGSDHSEVVQPGAHRKLWILCLNGLRAGALDFLCVCAQREAELDEGLEQTAVDPVLLAISGRQEIPSAELDRPLCKGRVKVAKSVS